MYCFICKLLSIPYYDIVLLYNIFLLYTQWRAACARAQRDLRLMALGAEPGCEVEKKKQEAVGSW